MEPFKLQGEEMTSFSTAPHILVSFLSSVNLQKRGEKGTMQNVFRKKLKQNLKLLFRG